jgi:hypothetical protein
MPGSLVYPSRALWYDAELELQTVQSTTMPGSLVYPSLSEAKPEWRLSRSALFFPRRAR